MSAGSCSTSLRFWSTASAVPRYHSAPRPRAIYGWRRRIPPDSVKVPWPPQPDVVVERARVVLRQDDHVRDVGVHAVRQGEVDDPVLAAERDGGLGAFLRQDREPLALAARRITAMVFFTPGLRSWGRRRVGASMLARGQRMTGEQGVALRSTSRDRGCGMTGQAAASIGSSAAAIITAARSRRPRPRRRARRR